MRIFSKISKEKGITLIALIITIIILLILAMVSLSLVMNQGILDKAKESTSDYKQSEEKEQITLAYQEYQMAKIQREETPSLTVSGATVTGNETEGWEITFEGTGNTYTLKADGGIEWNNPEASISFTFNGHIFKIPKRMDV